MYTSPSFPIQRRDSALAASAGRPTPVLVHADLRPPPPATAVVLLDQARAGLDQAEEYDQPADRFAGAHLAALRAAAAVLVVRGRPHRGRARPTSVWVLLARVAPELREWAAFFAAGSATRAAVQAGVTRLVTPRDADDLIRQAGQFVVLVERVLYGGHR